MSNSFGAKSTLAVGNKDYVIYRLDALADKVDLKRLPFCLKVMLENLLRKEDGKNVTAQDIETLCRWRGTDAASKQVNFTPARVVLQDFTGVPAIVDLAAMRDAMRTLKGDPAKINPLGAVDLVIDHSVMVDYFGSPDALEKNTQREFERNRERYQFLRWGQQAFSNFRVVPPGTGIVHQVNLEYLAKVVLTEQQGEETLALLDTLVGTDSHTTMINGLGVLGWGVGGIEAEAAMLGQPITMLIPEVVGFELKGALPPSATATDLVLTITQMLREHGVVGKFVEFYGSGLSRLPLADRATIANMAPEYGATCGIFPIDGETLRYLRFTGRSEEQVALVEAYAQVQGLWRNDDDPVAEYSDNLQLDLSTVVPSIAGPKRPQDRIPLTEASAQFIQLKESQQTQQASIIAREADSRFLGEGGQTAIDNTNTHDCGMIPVELNGEKFLLSHGSVVIAAITSCTNTSNPAVLVAAGLVAKKARERGLQTKPWVKTSFAPGSQVVPAYMENAGLLQPLSELGFDIVGFGCTTCIGNSGPLPPPISHAIHVGDLLVAGVLSGNRNFEGRIHQEVPANYLASPPLVVAYALAGNMRVDLLNESLGTDQSGNPVYLKDIWPTPEEVSDAIAHAMTEGLFQEKYADVFTGTDDWRALSVPQEEIYTWPDSTYVEKPPYFDGMSMELPPVPVITAARCLVKVGDSITTDHISPAGAIRPDSPAGLYLTELGVKVEDFNSYGSRRGNHEVMVRGTFANVRLRNQLAPGTEGGWTTYLPTDEQMSIFAASEKYLADKTPLIVLAGKEYGTGSSRDWAAKGANLLGVKAVIAESFERIHRSNLVGFGILPLRFPEGENADSLGLDGTEIYSIEPLNGEPHSLKVTAQKADGTTVEFDAEVRIDTAVEWDYYRHGGILHYVLRQLA